MTDTTSTTPQASEKAKYLVAMFDKDLHDFYVGGRKPGTNPSAALLAYIAELEAENVRLWAELDKHRWIPISEKYPPEQEYVVTVYDAVTDQVGDGFLDEDDVWLWDEVPATPIKQVTHWQEKQNKPEPPAKNTALFVED